MADRITLNFAANTVDVERGTEKISASIDDVNSELQKLGEQGEAAGEGVKAGQDAAATSLDDVGTSADSATGKLGDLGSVGKQALEGDIGGAAQSAAGLLSGLGPAAAIAATLAAAGIGFISDALGKQNEAAEKAKQALIDMYRDAAQAGQDFIDQAAIDANVLDTLLDSTKKADAERRAAVIGVDASTLIQAEAGDYTALKYAIEQATQAEKVRQAQTGTSAGEGQVADTTLGDIREVRTALESLAGQHEANRAALADYDTYQSQVSASETSRIQRTADADQARYTGLAALQRSVANPPPIQVTVDTAAAEAALKRLTQRARNIEIGVVYRNGKPVLQ